MTINERIKALRKELGLNQKDFGSRIGIKANSLSDIEKGKNAVTESNIKLICEKFNLNETWLRTGEGEREAITSDSIVEDLLKRGMQPGLAAVVEAFLELEPEKQTAITNIIKRAAQKINEAETAQGSTFELTETGGKAVPAFGKEISPDIAPEHKPAVRNEFDQARAILDVEEARLKGESSPSQQNA